MKKLPVFKTRKQEADFWDTHSPLDYPDEFNDLKDPFEFSPRLLKKAAKRREERKRQLTMRLEEQQIELAKIIAKFKGLAYQTQMRMWIVQGIRREIAEHPQIRKLLAPK